VLRPDPWRTLDAQPNVVKLIEGLEARGRAQGQVRLRRRFLRFVPVPRGGRVLEVGCGSGVVLRDLAAMVGRRGEAVGVDPSRTILDAARRLSRRAPGGRIALRHAAGAHLPGSLAVVREMARVTRPGGRVGLQDQDFGMLAVTHPDRALTDRIMQGVAAAVYPEPYSGRRLPRLLVAAGLQRVRVLTDFFQDTALEPWTKTFLERRAENAVRYEVVDEPTAQRWLDGFTAEVAAGTFVLTMVYYGAVGVKPA